MHGINREGILGTVLFHILVILILLLIKLYTGSTSAGEGVLLIDFEEGGATRKIIEQKVTKQTEIDYTREEKILTQDYEEAPLIKETSKEKKKKEIQKKEIEKEIVEEEKPKIDQSRLFRKDLISDMQSSETGNGTGNSQGSGAGSGGYGDATGSGGGAGTGMSFSLEGRGKVYLHEPPKIFSTSGIVVVEIIVDKDGNVVSAREGVKGTTTTDPMLLKLAKESALKSKFTANPDAPYHQKGTITYYFKIK